MVGLREIKTEQGAERTDEAEGTGVTVEFGCLDKRLQS
jgi:hypothetical protein